MKSLILFVLFFLSLNSAYSQSTNMEFSGQIWREIPWKHILRVVEPPHAKRNDLMILYLSGSSTGGKALPFIKDLVDKTELKGGVVSGIPNQPLFNDLSENELVAYTFDRYRKTGDESWPLLFPMVKGVQAAMDQAQRRWPEIKGFILVGASKRGWTAWLTAAKDARVVAIAPAVFDMLNMKEQVKHARQAYGKDSEKIRAFTALGLTDAIEEPAITKLRSLVDPFELRDKIKIPKLLLLGTNDPYWVVDSSSLYFDQLQGRTSMYYTPQSGHKVLDEVETQTNLANWIIRFADKIPEPVLRWKFSEQDKQARVSVESSVDIDEALLWEATSANRDFRESKWSSKPISIADHRRLSGVVTLPETGFKAYFIELDFLKPNRLRLSSEINVVNSSN